MHELTRGEIELGLRRADRRLRVTAGPSNDRPHAREQLTKIEWLDEIIVRTEIETRHAIIETIASREHQHRSAIAVLPRAAQDFQSRPARQAEIEQHRSVTALGERVLRKHSVAHPIDGQASLGQRLPQAVTD